MGGRARPATEQQKLNRFLWKLWLGRPKFTVLDCSDTTQKSKRNFKPPPNHPQGAAKEWVATVKAMVKIQSNKQSLYQPLKLRRLINQNHRLRRSCRVAHHLKSRLRKKLMRVPNSIGLCRRMIRIRIDRLHRWLMSSGRLRFRLTNDPKTSNSIQKSAV